MAVRLKAALRTMLGSLISDPSRMGQISAMDVRDQLGDHIDSLLDGPSVQATDSSIVIDRSTPGVIRLSAPTSGGGTPPVPTTYPTLRFGTSTDAIPEADELAVVGVMGQGVIDAYVGNMHLLIARLASEGDISTVKFSNDLSQTNQMGAFTKQAATVVPAGETEAFNVWVGNQAVTNSAEVTITVN